MQKDKESLSAIEGFTRAANKGIGPVVAIAIIAGTAITSVVGVAARVFAVRDVIVQPNPNGETASRRYGKYQVSDFFQVIGGLGDGVKEVIAPPAPADIKLPVEKAPATPKDPAREMIDTIIDRAIEELTTPVTENSEPAPAN